MKTSTLLAALAAWFALALTLTFVAPPPVLRGAARFAVIVGPVIALTMLYAASRSFREALSGLSLRVVVGLHLIRALVGAWFLVLGSQGLLPAEFTTPAGIGDIAAGLGALGLLFVPNWQGRGMALALLAWCVFGIADFVNVQRVVVMLAAQGRQAEFIALSGPPLALVPYFGVPLLWFSHVLVIVRSVAQVRRLSTKSPPEGVTVQR